MKSNVWKRFWGWLAVFWLLFFVVQTVVLFFGTNLYEGRVWLEPRSNGAGSLVAVVEKDLEPVALPTRWSDPEAHLESLRSQKLAESVAADLALGKEWELGETEATARLMSRIEAGRIPESNLIEVRVRDESAELAAKIANTVAAMHVEIIREQWEEALRSREAGLLSEIEALRREAPSSEIDRKLELLERSRFQASGSFQPLVLHEQAVPNFDPVSPNVRVRQTIHFLLSLLLAAPIAAFVARKGRQRETKAAGKPEAQKTAGVGSLAKLRPHAGVVIVIFLLLFAWHGFLYQGLPREHEARVAIEPRALEAARATHLPTQAKILLSRETLTLAVRKLSLVNEWNLSTETEAYLQLLEKLEVRSSSQPEAVMVVLQGQHAESLAQMLDAVVDSYAQRRVAVHNAALERELATLGMWIGQSREMVEAASTVDERSRRERIMEDLKTAYRAMESRKKRPSDAVRPLGETSVSEAPVEPRLSWLFVHGGGKSVIYALLIGLLFGWVRHRFGGKETAEPVAGTMGTRGWADSADPY